MNKSPTELEMKFEAAVRGRVTSISGFRSFTEASVAVHTLGHAASFATACLVRGFHLGLGLGWGPTNKSPTEVKMKLEAAVRGRATPISGLRSFTKASVAVQTLGHAASFATVCLVGVAFTVGL